MGEQKGEQDVQIVLQGYENRGEAVQEMDCLLPNVGRAKCLSTPSRSLFIFY